MAPMSSAPASSLPTAPVLVERERELQQLAGLVRDALGGDGRTALIEGPAGIGKSRLLQEARRQAAEQGALVLSARGGELERDFPFGVVRQLFEGRARRPGAARDRLHRGRRPRAVRAGLPRRAGRGRRRLVRGAARPVLARAEPRRRAADRARDRRPAVGGPPQPALRRLPRAAPRGPADPRRHDPAHGRRRRRRGAAGRDRARPVHARRAALAADHRGRARADRRAARRRPRSRLLRRLPRRHRRQPAAAARAPDRARRRRRAAGRVPRRRRARHRPARRLADGAGPPRPPAGRRRRRSRGRSRCSATAPTSPTSRP